MVEQQFRRFQVIARHGFVQRVAPGRVVFRGVRVGAVVQQELHDVGVSLARRAEQRRVAAGVLVARQVGVTRQELPHATVVPQRARDGHAVIRPSCDQVSRQQRIQASPGLPRAENGHVQRFAPVPPDRIRFRPLVQEQGRHFQVVFFHGLVQGTVAPFIRGVDQIGGSLEKRAGFFQVAPPDHLAGGFAHGRRVVPGRNGVRQESGNLVISAVPGPLERRYVVIEPRRGRGVGAVVEQQADRLRVPFPDGEVQRLVVRPVAVGQAGIRRQQRPHAGQVSIRGGQQHFPDLVRTAIHETALLGLEIGSYPTHNSVSECVFVRRRAVIEIFRQYA